MNKYDDIINLPYKKSIAHRHMSNHDRAAQFAPFAALTGYNELIKETGRKVEKKKTLSKDKKEEISAKLNYLKNLDDNIVPISITYFVKDTRKDGGEYITSEIYVLKIDEYNKTIRFDNVVIKINDIYDIQSSLFDKFDLF